MAKIIGTAPVQLDSVIKDANSGITTIEVSQVYLAKVPPPNAKQIVERYISGKYLYVKKVRDERIAAGLMRRSVTIETPSGYTTKPLEVKEPPNEPLIYDPPDPQMGPGAGATTLGKDEYVVSFQLIDMPIATHPNILTLMDKYGGVSDANGNVSFPNPKLSGGTGTNTGGGEVNKMFGVTSWKVPITYGTHRYYTKTPPIGGEGMITTPPAQIATMSAFENESWMLVGKNSTQRGNYYMVEKTYMSSGPGGFNRDIYDVH